MLAFIFDRTIGWDKFYERITYTQFTDGVFDREGVKVAHGTSLSRRTLNTCLADLISWGVVLRRIETGCKGEPKYYYAINLGAGVGVKNRDGATFTCRGVDYLSSVPNLFQIEKQGPLSQPVTIMETVFVNGRVVETAIESTMNLRIPKRLKTNIVPIEKSFDDLAKEEFGEPPVKEVNCPRFTLSPTEAIDQFNSDTESNTEYPKSAEVNSAETKGAVAPVCEDKPIAQAMDELHQILDERVEEWDQHKQRKQEATFEKTYASIQELERVWNIAYKEVFDALPIPWGGKQRGQVKVMQKKWLASERVQFAKAMDYFVRHWQEIGALYFNLQSADGPDGGKYPNRPEIGFLVVCMSTFARAYEDKKRVEDVPAMNKKELFVERLRVRGYDDGKIAALVERKFKPKEEKPKVDHGAWKDMIAAKAQKSLQPVAIPEPLKPTDEPTNIVTFKLPEWK